jgi:hypothetical protein
MKVANETAMAPRTKRPPVRGGGGTDDEFAFMRGS